MVGSCVPAVRSLEAELHQEEAVNMALLHGGGVQLSSEECAVLAEVRERALGAREGVDDTAHVAERAYASEHVQEVEEEEEEEEEEEQQREEEQKVIAPATSRAADDSPLTPTHHHPPPTTHHSPPTADH